jgi:hypothetical protein
MRLQTALAALLVFSTASPALAQTRGRGWIDVNFGAAASRAGSDRFVFEGMAFDEPLSLNATYPDPPTGGSFDFGGGFMVTRFIGIGLSLSGTAHRSDSTVAVIVPHPFFFNASANAAGTTERLTRAEGAVHIQAVVVPYNERRVRVRLFGGPSRFRYRADMVQDIAFLQIVNPSSRANTVTITTSNVVEAEGSGWGFHVGGNVDYFFSRFAGAGGFVRFSAGDVTVRPEPLSEVDQSMRVGGLQMGGGLRFRF